MDARLVENSDIIVAMSSEHLSEMKRSYPDYADRMRLFPAGEVSDPYGGDSEIYRMTAEQIYSGVISLIESMEKD